MSIFIALYLIALLLCACLVRSIDVMFSLNLNPTATGEVAMLWANSLFMFNILWRAMREENVRRLG